MCLEPGFVFEDHRSSACRVLPAGHNHPAGVGGHHRCAQTSGDVNATVELGPTGEGGLPVPISARNMAPHRQPGFHPDLPPSIGREDHGGGRKGNDGQDDHAAPPGRVAAPGSGTPDEASASTVGYGHAAVHRLTPSSRLRLVTFNSGRRRAVVKGSTQQPCQSRNPGATALGRADRPRLVADPPPHVPGSNRHKFCRASRVSSHGHRSDRSGGSRMESGHPSWRCFPVPGVLCGGGAPGSAVQASTPPTFAPRSLSS